MRNWHPLLPDTLRAMAQDGVRRAIGFICAPHRSFSSCTQYRQNVIDAAAEIIGARTAGRRRHLCRRLARPPSASSTPTPSHVRAALDRLPRPLRSRRALVFTAHSIPVADGGRRSISRAVDGIGAPGRRPPRHSIDWALVFQSRSGRPEDPWLEPDVCDYLRAERPTASQAAVLCPIGFVCDHIEVLYDLDHEAAAVCREIGLPMVRAEAVNDDPRFLDTMAGR